MEMMTIAKKFYDLGLAVIWLRPNSKEPVEKGWTSGERTSWKELKNKYRNGNNVGVRLGDASVIDGKYLCALDVDVKSGDKRHRKEAEAWINEHFRGLMASAPITLSGRGNGSMHIFFLCKKPAESRTLFQSSEIVEVHMPSAKPTRYQVEQLGEKKIKEGFRLRPAFEIDFMSTGRQVVFPPSIHPDSGRAYKFRRDFSEKIPTINIKEVLSEIPEQKKTKERIEKSKAIKIKIVDVDQMQLETRLPYETLVGIIDGDGVEDRSGFLLSVCHKMIEADFKREEILGVLTNEDYYIGSVAYEHAKTKNRKVAARWILRYSLTVAEEQLSFENIFDEEIEESLNEEDAEKQEKKIKKIIKKQKDVNWTIELDRDGHDNLKPTFKNTKMILENDISKDCFKFDTFAYREIVNSKDFPFKAKVGDFVNDQHSIFLKDWMAKKWKIEPATKNIEEAVIGIAHTNVVHPVKNYLESLEWDGVPRIDTWLKDYVGIVAPEPYLSDISRKFLIASVTRIFLPGQKFDHMIIFQGMQGIGKSTVGRVLAGDEYFLDNIGNISDKDSALNLLGNWFVEVGELSQFSRSNIEEVKAYVARSTDKVRPPYGKRVVILPRQCVFFGTTNKETYLKDKTGNRRFWIALAEGLIDLDGLREVRDQLFAEAVWHFHNSDEKLYLDNPKSKEQLEKLQSKAMVEDDWDLVGDALLEWLKPILKANKKAFLNGEVKNHFSIYSLFSDLGDGVFINSPYTGAKHSTLLTMQISDSLKKIGLEKITIKGKNRWKISDATLRKLAP